MQGVHTLKLFGYAPGEISRPYVNVRADMPLVHPIVMLRPLAQGLGVSETPKKRWRTRMKSTLGVVIAAVMMTLGAGYANAAVGSNAGSLRLLSTQSSAVQDVYWRRWHHHHRHCWWRHGYRHCRWW